MRQVGAYIGPFESWLPASKRAAIALSIDDVHPGRSRDAYEAGGDLERGALGHLAWLLERHPRLRATLFVTPDWREISPRPTRRLLARIPLIRDRFYLAPVLPKGTMRLDRHRRFARYLRDLPRTEIALHGLHHVHRGLRIPVEFQGQNREGCRAMLRQGLEIFERAALPHVRGVAPPGWSLSAALAGACADLGFDFVASARDLETSVSRNAETSGSGIRGAPLIQPGELEAGLVHFTTNFQATSGLDRALSILDHGGLLAIKAHIVKNAFGHIALDGLDEAYRDYLDGVLGEIGGRYGEELWWTSFGEIAARLRAARAPSLAASPGV